MRAAVVRTPGGPEAIEIIDAPTPEPGPCQVRLEVHAATVNPVDVLVRTGVGDPSFAAPRDQWGLGWDAAGVVDAVGPGVTRFARGDAVLGISDRLDVSLAAQAEYVVLDADHVTAAPTTVDAVHAATIPLNGLTAWQALDAVGPAGRCGTLLVTGAAGAVGGAVVELAVDRGARVIATGRRSDRGLLTRLGAAHLVDRDRDLPSAVRALVPGGVDAVVDAAGIGAVALAAARGGAEFAVVVPGTSPTPLRGTRVHEVYIRADADQLAALVRLVDAGRLTPRVADVSTLDELAEAHRRLAAGGLRGRLVVTPRPADLRRVRVRPRA